MMRQLGEHREACVRMVDVHGDWKRGQIVELEEARK